MEDNYTSISLDDFKFKIRHINLSAQRKNEIVCIILPGFGGVAEAFESNMEILYQNGYWPMVVENIGFGKSDKPKFFRYSIRNLIRVISNWIRIHKIDKFVLIGTSLGGGVALGVWERFKPQVKSIVLIAPAGFGKGVVLSYKLASLPIIRDLFVYILYNRFFQINKGSKSWDSIVFDSSKLTKRFIQVSDKIKADVGLRYSYNYILRHYISIKGQSDRLNNKIHKICHKLRKTKVPVQIIWGKNDHVIPLTHSKSVIKHTNGQLNLINNAGHMPYLEQPKVFNHHLISFLKKNELIIEN